MVLALPQPGEFAAKTAETEASKRQAVEKKPCMMIERVCGDAVESLVASSSAHINTLGMFALAMFHAIKHNCRGRTFPSPVFLMKFAGIHSSKTGGLIAFVPCQLLFVILFILLISWLRRKA